MTPAIVLIVCLSQPAGQVDQNSGFTGHENREWVYQNSKMVCRREVMELVDGAELKGADPQPFNTQRCIASAVRLATDWDLSHKDSSKYRVWRVACPTPTIDTQTGKIVGWVLPDCGHRETVICEKDTVI